MVVKKAVWKTENQLNYQYPYQDSPVFTNVEIEKSDEDTFLKLSKKDNNDNNILYSNIVDFTLSNSNKITIADGVAKLKSGIGIDINFPFTNLNNYNISDSNKIGISDGKAKLLLQYLYAFWKFNETSGNNILDSSGNNRNGLMYNMSDADWQVGKLNNCLHYNVGSSTNEYSLFGNIAAFERTDKFSYEWWMRGINGGTRIIFSKTPYGAWHGLEVFVINGKVSIYLIGSGEQIYKQGSVPISTGDWMHCVITYNGNSDHTGIKIYINNVECGIGGTGSLTTSLVNNSDFQISGRGGMANFVLDDYMIDNFRIFSKELSIQEISDLYNNGNGTENLGFPIDHPYISNKEGISFSAKLTSFVETAIKNNGTEIKYQISDDGVTKYYWNGVDWDISDGSYEQSSLASEINNNLNSWSSSGVFKWFAVFDSNNGIDTPILDNIYITSPSNYSTDDNLYIDTKISSQINPENIFNWISSIIENNKPENTYISILVSVDGKNNWLKWNGSDWVIVSNPILRSNANSISDFENNFSKLPIGNGTLDIRLFLKTNNLSVTPSVEKINVISDAGYYTVGSYVSTQYYPQGYYVGLLFKSISFNTINLFETNVKMYVKFYIDDEIENNEDDYIEYNSDEDIDICENMIQWKVVFSSSGKNTSKISNIKFLYQTLVNVMQNINNTIDNFINKPEANNPQLIPFVPSEVKKTYISMRELKL